MKITFERVAIVALIIALLFVWNCRGEKEVVAQPKKIEVPEVKGKFETVIPKQTPLKPKYIKGDIQYYAVEDTAYTNEVIRKMLFYKNANDSLQAVLYNKEVEVKEYSQTLNDTNVQINVNGRNTGTILSMNIDYTVKAKSIELPYKKTFRYRVLGGGEVGINKDLNKGVIKANLMYQNKKSNITSLSYMKIGSQEYGLIGFHKNLFTRNK